MQEADPQAAFIAAREQMRAEIAGGETVQPVAPRPERPGDEYERAAKEALRIQQAETRRLNKLRAQELKMQADWASKGRKGLPPQSALPRIKPLDATAQLDSDGKPAGELGTLKKWVPLLDANGREVSLDNSYEVLKHRNEGYRFVESRDETREDKRFTSPFGVFMEIDPLDAVRREFSYGSGTLAVTPEDYFAAQAESEINAGNVGNRYVTTEVRQEHGRYLSGSLKE